MLKVKELLIHLKDYRGVIKPIIIKKPDLGISFSVSRFYDNGKLVKVVPTITVHTNTRQYVVIELDDTNLDNIIDEVKFIVDEYYKALKELEVDDVISTYINSIGEAKKYGEVLCHKFVEALKPIIPDIECSLGWDEAGVDTICLWSESHDVSNTGIDEGVSIERIIEEVFPELKGRIDAPFGVFLIDDEVEKVKQALLKLRAKIGGENK